MYTNDQLKNYMTLKEFEELISHINEHHSFAHSEGKRIKYIDPTFDVRIQRIFHVKLRKGAEEKHFSLTNENKDRNLFKWIVDWLDNGTWD